MNEKLIENIEEIVAYLKTGLDTAIEFGQGNIPLLVNEILNYSLATSILFALIFAILPLLYIIRVKAINLMLQGVADSDPGHIIVINLLMAVPTILSFIAVVSHLAAAIKILIAPRLFLLEYVSDLIK